MADDDAASLQDFLPYRLILLAEDAARSLAQLHAERHGIGLAEWRVIAALGRTGRRTAKAIGAEAGMHKTMVSRAVAALAEKGLVERTPNVDDLREALLGLTAKGLTLHDALLPEAERFVARWAGALEPDERALLAGALAKLARARAAAEPAERAPPPRR